jgi:hypothetical protein
MKRNHDRYPFPRIISAIGAIPTSPLPSTPTDRHTPLPQKIGDGGSGLHLVSEQHVPASLVGDEPGTRDVLRCVLRAGEGDDIRRVDDERGSLDLFQRIERLPMTARASVPAGSRSLGGLSALPTFAWDSWWLLAAGGPCASVIASEKWEAVEDGPFGPSPRFRALPHDRLVLT